MEFVKIQCGWEFRAVRGPRAVVEAAHMSKLNRQHHRSLLAIAVAWTFAIAGLYWGSEWLFEKLKIPYMVWEYAMQDWVTKQARPAETSSTGRMG